MTRTELSAIAAAFSLLSAHGAKYAINGGDIGCTNGAFYAYAEQVTVGEDATIGNETSYVAKTSITIPANVRIKRNGVVTTNASPPSVVYDNTTGWLKFDVRSSNVIPDDLPISNTFADEIETDDLIDYAWGGYHYDDAVYYLAEPTNGATTSVRLPRKIDKVRPFRFNKQTHECLIAALEAHRERMIYASQGEHPLHYETAADPITRRKLTNIVDNLKYEVSKDFIDEDFYGHGQTLIFQTNGIKTVTIEPPSAATPIIPHWWSSTLMDDLVDGANVWPSLDWTNSSNIDFPLVFTNSAYSFYDTANESVYLDEVNTYAISMADLDDDDDTLSDLRIYREPRFHTPEISTNWFPWCFNSRVTLQESINDAWSQSISLRHFPVHICSIDQGLALMNRTIHIPRLIGFKSAMVTKVADRKREFTFNGGAAVAYRQGIGLNCSSISGNWSAGPEIVTNSTYSWEHQGDVFVSFPGVSQNDDLSIHGRHSQKFFDFTLANASNVIYEMRFWEPYVTNRITYSAHMTSDGRIVATFTDAGRVPYVMEAGDAAFTVPISHIVRLYRYVSGDYPTNFIYTLSPTQPGTNGWGRVVDGTAQVGAFHHIYGEVGRSSETPTKYDYCCSCLNEYTSRETLDRSIRLCLGEREGCGVLKKIFSLCPLDVRNLQNMFAIPADTALTVGQPSAAVGVEGDGWIDFVIDSEEGAEEFNIIYLSIRVPGEGGGYEIYNLLDEPYVTLATGTFTVTATVYAPRVTGDTPFTFRGIVQPITFVDWDWKNMSLRQVE